MTTTSKFSKAALAITFTLLSSSYAFAENTSWLADKSKIVTRTIDQIRRQVYDKEVELARQKAEKNGDSFVPAPYEKWESSPPGTFYPDSCENGCE